MNDLQPIFESLGTAPVADACVREGLPLRCAPSGMSPLVTGLRVAGRALPVRHFGSVDVFLEGFGRARGGEVMVIDNGGRLDEACIGDLTAMEALSAGVRALVVWGAHRDARLLRELECPVWSLGGRANGPLAARERAPDAMHHAFVGEARVGPDDFVFADDDGVLFVAREHIPAVLAGAREIAERERRQAEAAAAGTSLRQQLHFEEYLARRERDPALTFRLFLREIAGEIER